jgi:hypothetical protein
VAEFVIVEAKTHYREEYSEVCINLDAVVNIVKDHSGMGVIHFGELREPLQTRMAFAELVEFFQRVTL